MADGDRICFVDAAFILTPSVGPFVRFYGKIWASVSDMYTQSNIEKPKTPFYLPFYIYELTKKPKRAFSPSKWQLYVW
jgi:hypothetical protein